MGKKESWLHALSSVVKPDPNEKKNTKKTRKLQLLFWKHKSQGLGSLEEADTEEGNPSPPSPNPEVELDSSEEAESAGVNPGPPSQKAEVKLTSPEIIEEARDGWAKVESQNEDARNALSVTNNTDDDQDRHDCSVPLASADAVVAPGKENAVVAQLTTASHSPFESKKDVAAFVIQSFFREYMARRSFRAEKGSTRLQTLVRGQPVKRQATTALKCMQTMARVQHQVRARRIRISNENQAFQRQLQQKHDLEKSKATMEDKWDGSTQSKEQVEEKRKEQEKAAIKRERTLAYAYTHQQTWRNSPKPETQTSIDLQWGWNWVEKWMATRPWENNTMEEESNFEPPSAKSVTTLAQKVRRDLNLEQVKSSASQKKQTCTPGRPSVSSSRIPETPNSASAGRGRVPNSHRRSVSSGDRLTVSSPRTTPPKFASAGRGRVPNSLRRSVSNGNFDEAYGRLSVSSPGTTPPKFASAGRGEVPKFLQRSVSNGNDDKAYGRLSDSSPRTTPPKFASAGRGRVTKSLRRSVSSRDDNDAYGRLSVPRPRITTSKSLSKGKMSVPNSPRRSVSSLDDDYTKSLKSARSEHHRSMPNSPRRSVSSVDDDNTKSAKTVRSERHRRQASYPVAPSFMTRTNSAKEKSRSSMEKSGTSEKDSTGSEKKRWSFTGPPSAQMHSEPLKTPDVH